MTHRGKKKRYYSYTMQSSTDTHALCSETWGCPTLQPSGEEQGQASEQVVASPAVLCQW